MVSGWVAIASRTLKCLTFIEAPFDGMDPQSNGAEIEQTSIKKKEAKKPSAKAQLATKEEYEVLEREEYEIDGETWVLEKRLYAVEGSMETARKNVGASTCWKGYKAAGTKKKGGKTVPNCVKAGDEVTHEGEELEEAKRGLYANIHAKRKRGGKMRDKGDEGAPTDKAFRDSAKTAKKEEFELTEKKLDPVGKEDKDIDNDGDHDKSDKYLLARRKKVSKIIGMGKEEKMKSFDKFREECGCDKKEKKVKSKK